MQLKHGALCIAALPTVSVFAQETNSPAVTNARVISVKIWHIGGLCGGSGYCDSSTMIKPSFIMSELTDSPNPKKFPNRRVKRSITKGEWGKLQRAIDSKSLKSLPAEHCDATIDVPCSGVKIQFSDSSEVNVIYDGMYPPVRISELLKQIPNNPISLSP
jgi:hypothetical protein